MKHIEELVLLFIASLVCASLKLSNPGWFLGPCSDRGVWRARRGNFLLN